MHSSGMPCAIRLEGIISKRADSRYKSGRCLRWLKIKNPEYVRGARVSRQSRSLVEDALRFSTSSGNRPSSTAIRQASSRVSG